MTARKVSPYFSSLLRPTPLTCSSSSELEGRLFAISIKVEIVEYHIGRQALFNGQLSAVGLEFFQQVGLVGLHGGFITLFPGRFLDPFVPAQEHLCLALQQGFALLGQQQGTETFHVDG